MADVLCLLFALLATASSANLTPRSYVVKTTTCNGEKYVYEELAGYGYLPSNGRDKFGDTLGGIGSSIAVDSSSWTKDGDTYKGTLYALPDRGWWVRKLDDAFSAT